MKRTLTLTAMILSLLLYSGAMAAPFTSCINTASDPGDDYNLYEIDPIGDPGHLFVDWSTNCTIDDGNDKDKLNTVPITVNEGGGFFGIDQWMFLGKIGSPENTVNGLDGDQEGLTGSWNFTGLGYDLEEVMFVFKDGNGTQLVGYYMDTSDNDWLIGSWHTPFLEPPFSLPGQSTSAATSHISVYYTGTPVPEPATLILLGSGLAGLAAYRRRR